MNGKTRQLEKKHRVFPFLGGFELPMDKIPAPETASPIPALFCFRVGFFGLAECTRNGYSR